MCSTAATLYIEKVCTYIIKPKVFIDFPKYKTKHSLYS